MGPELDLKPNPEALAKSTSVLKDPRGNLFPCVNNYRKVTFDVEPSSITQTTKPDRIENEEINITNVTHSLNAGMVGTDDSDTVETSSSFGDTESATDDDLAGDEVQSQSHGDLNPGSEFGGYYDMFRMRNKKLTPHWRKFIRPLMWRCKWMELRMKELQSQALKYDKELAAYDKGKKLEFGMSVSEDLEGKSLSFSDQIQRNKVMKRKMRKRVEETVDIESYMSQHNFFSYYENKKSVPNGPSSQVDFGNLGNTSYHNNNNEFGTSEEFSLESLDGDSQLEALFRDIEAVQSRVRQLITRVDVVVYVNSRKISSMNKFSAAGLPQSPVGNSAPNAFLPCGKGKGLRKAESLCIGSQSTSEKSTGDVLMLDGGVSSHGEVTPRSEVNGSKDQFRVGDLLTNTEEVLIDNVQAKEELHDFEKFRDQFGEKAQVSGEVIENPNQVPVPVPEADSVPPSKANVRTKAKKRKRKAGSRK